MTVLSNPVDECNVYVRESWLDRTWLTLRYGTTKPTNQPTNQTNNQRMNEPKN